MSTIPVVLTIAGSETSGGAGMQADLKTFEEYGCHGMVALTSIVTMDPQQNWAHDVAPVALDTFKKQLTTVLAGPKLNAMKTGMLPSYEIIQLVQDTIKQESLTNVVIDPVMVCKAENSLLNVANADALRDMLIPLATIATPNLFEAGVLSGLGTLSSIEDMKKAAKKIHALGAQHVVVKGGKTLGGETAVDVYYDGRQFELLTLPKVNNTYNQGAGCSFSAAIAAGLACGLTPLNAIIKAKEYVRSAILHGFAFNQFVGPVYHAAHRLIEKQPLPSVFTP